MIQPPKKFLTRTGSQRLQPALGLPLLPGLLPSIAVLPAAVRVKSAG